MKKDVLMTSIDLKTNQVGDTTVAKGLWDLLSWKIADLVEATSKVKY